MPVSVPAVGWGRRGRILDDTIPQRISMCLSLTRCRRRLLLAIGQLALPGGTGWTVGCATFNGWFAALISMMLVHDGRCGYMLI